MSRKVQTAECAGLAESGDSMEPNNNLSEIVHKYRQSNPRHDELKFFRELPNLEAAIHHAAFADIHGTRHPHQHRLTKKALTEAKQNLIKNYITISQAKDFDSLFQYVKRSCCEITGIGELYVYDTSLRIGAKLNLMPAKVYLHRGTRVGARVLGLGSKVEALEISQMPPELRKLEAYEIEDFLCFLYKDQRKQNSKHKKYKSMRSDYCT